jgi:dTDP-4-amino-4,6-dideoxygalactose transaminase
MNDDLFSDQIPLLRPWLGEEEAEAAREVILSGWISLGPRTQQFENAVADLVGARRAVATSSATAALHLALQTAGLQRGDEVIMPTFTCMANANAVLLAGGVPRFADIERSTYNLDPADVERRLTERTRAVMVVDQIGLPANLDAFRDLAERNGLLLVDDAATAFGARYKDRYLGGHGITTCYSFHPRKMITTGEGGMLVTDDVEQAERATRLRSTGASNSDLARHRAKGALFQEYNEAGYNYRMTDIQAAIGLVQIAKLPEMLRQRSEQATRYGELLEEFEEVATPYVPEHAEHAFSSYCIRLTPEARVSAEEVVRRMAVRNVSCRRGIASLHREPVFLQTHAGEEFPEAEAASRETLFLPIFPGLTPDAQEVVVRALAESLRAVG